MNRVLWTRSLLACLASLLVLGISGWAQRGKPKPPVPPADPAIAYTWSSGSTAPASQADLMIMNADGSNLRALVSQNGTHNGAADWSPDGKQLVFASDAPGYSGINIINVDGTGRRRLNIADHEQLVATPFAWSPVPLADGQYKILFMDRGRNPDGTRRGDNDLYIVNLDGSGCQDWTNTETINESPFDGYCEMAWSFDARFVAVAMDSNILVYEISYDDSTGAFSITRSGYVLDPGEQTIDLTDVDWANNSYRLVFANGYEISAAELLNPYETDQTDKTLHFNHEQWTFTSSAYEIDPAWSPDDSKIVFARRGASGIWVMDAMAGAVPSQITAKVNKVSQHDPQWRRNLLPQ